MFDLSLASEPSSEVVDKIINRIGKRGISIINSQSLSDIQSVDDLKREIVQFWRRMNVFIGYEEKHPLVDEVPDAVKHLIAPPILIAPEKGCPIRYLRIIFLGTIDIIKNSVAQSTSIIKERHPYADTYLFRGILKIHEVIMQIKTLSLIAPIESLMTLEHFEFLQLEQGENFLSEMNKNYNSRIESLFVQAVAEARSAKSGKPINLVNGN